MNPIDTVINLVLRVIVVVGAVLAANASLTFFGTTVPFEWNALAMLLFSSKPWMSFVVEFLASWEAKKTTQARSFTLSERVNVFADPVEG